MDFGYWKMYLICNLKIHLSEVKLIKWSHSVKFGYKSTFWIFSSLQLLNLGHSIQSAKVKVYVQAKYVRKYDTNILAKMQPSDNLAYIILTKPTSFWQTTVHWMQVIKLQGRSVSGTTA